MVPPALGGFANQAWRLSHFVAGRVIYDSVSHKMAQRFSLICSNREGEWLYAPNLLDSGRLLATAQTRLLSRSKSESATERLTDRRKQRDRDRGALTKFQTRSPKP